MPVQAPPSAKSALKRTSVTRSNVGEPVDTRSRILHAAQRLFRKHGYHATGLNDILDMAQAPKGSMYHHFPDGKEEIGVCVIAGIADDLLTLFAQNAARSTCAMVLKAGEQLVVVAEKTQFEFCALFSAFVAERKSSPVLGQAVAAAYGRMLDALQARLMEEGFSVRAAKAKAQLTLAMLEGGSLLALARQDANLFRATVKQAAEICRKN